MSKVSEEVIIHVDKSSPQPYDYRYGKSEPIKQKYKVLEHIVENYLLLHKRQGQEYELFEHDTPYLNQWHTKKGGKSKAPNSEQGYDVPLLMTLKEFKDYNQERIRKRKTGESYKNLFGKDNKLHITDFDSFDKVLDIGSGAYGKVQLVEVKNTDKQYAIKI